MDLAPYLPGMLAAYTILVVGVLLSQAAWAMSLLKLVGALYLSYLAYGAFKKMLSPPKLVHLPTEKRPNWQLFLAGYLLQVINPKAIAFWLAIASVRAMMGSDLVWSSFSFWARSLSRSSATQPGR